MKDLSSIRELLVLLVSEDRQSGIRRSRCKCNAENCNQGSVTSQKVGCVGRKESVGCNDAAGISKTNEERCSNTPLDVSLEIHDVPAYDDGTSSKSPHCDQVKTRILNSEVFVVICQKHYGPYENDRVA